MSKKASKKDEEPRVLVKNPADLQRLKIEKLMKNPEKEVIIPERAKEKKVPPPAPEFIRNVMGSSAGAGSGEFHVYRHLRRKEYARQKFIQHQKEKVQLDEEYHDKIAANQQAADERTAKKRAKRLKKKEKYKRAKKNKSKVKKEESDSEEGSEDEESDPPKEEEIKKEEPEEEIKEEAVEEKNIEVKEEEKDIIENKSE